MPSVQSHGLRTSWVNMLRTHCELAEWVPLTRDLDTLEEYWVTVSCIHTTGVPTVALLEYCTYSIYVLRSEGTHISSINAGRSVHRLFCRPLVSSRKRWVHQPQKSIKRRSVEGIIRDFVARHAGHRTDDQESVWENDFT